MIILGRLGAVSHHVMRNAAGLHVPGETATRPDNAYSSAMPIPAKRPLLFLDVDGTLIPIGGPPVDSGRNEVAHSNPLLSRINPEHGRWLATLPCDLVWATTWMDDANDAISPLLNLPELPVVDWPDDDDDGPVHWKTRGLVTWAAGRPFVWIDDEITDADRTWVAAHHPGRALLHRVDPRTGLTEHDFAAIREWISTSLEQQPNNPDPPDAQVTSALG
jgi:hypothetical protein